MNNLTNWRIALAEDDIDDQELFRQALEQVNNKAELTTFKDGNDLMQTLLSEESALPNVVFLDLNMPMKGGMECLAEIRSHEALKELPVVILTTSENQNDIKKAYENKACLFFHKPDKHSTLVTIIQKVLSMKLEPWNPISF